MEKLGLTLSGGGVRGIMHIGVLKALEEEGIRPGIISGTSAGAIIGAFYAAGLSPDQIMKIVDESGWFKIVKPAIPVKGFMTLDYLRKLMVKHIPEDNFSALHTPLLVTVTNLNSGELEVYQDGPLFDRVVASASVPLMFEPVQDDGTLYLDGGLMMNLPASPIRDRCRFLLGVNLVPKVPLEKRELSGIVRIAMRCFDIAIISNMEKELSLLDWVIQPEALNDLSMFDFSFSKGRQLYQLGYTSTKEMMPAILKALE